MMLFAIIGGIAVIFAILSIVSMIRKKETKWFRFLSLSLTAIAVCIFYWGSSKNLIAGDYSELYDVMPTARIMLWVCTVGSILINGITLFAKTETDKK